MQRTDVHVTTPEGECPAILITPDGDGPFAPVILFTDAGGVRAVDGGDGRTARRDGLRRLPPEMFYRDVPYEPFDLATVFGDPEQRGRLMAMMGKVTVQAAAERHRCVHRLPRHRAVGRRQPGSAPPATAWAASSR